MEHDFDFYSALMLVYQAKLSDVEKKIKPSSVKVCLPINFTYFFTEEI